MKSCFLVCLQSLTENAEDKRDLTSSIDGRLSPLHTCISCHVSSSTIERVVGCSAGTTTGSGSGSHAIEGVQVLRSTHVEW